MGNRRPTINDFMMMIVSQDWNHGIKGVLEYNLSDDEVDNLIVKILREKKHRAISLFFILGRAFKVRNEIDNAIEVYKALTDYDNVPGAHFFLAQLFYKQALFIEAQKSLDKCEITLNYPGALLLQFNLWRRMKQFRTVIDKTTELFRIGEVPLNIKQCLQVNLAYVLLEMYRKCPKLKSDFELIEGYFENLAKVDPQACYGIVFLYEIALKCGHLSYEEAAEWMPQYLQWGFQDDPNKSSKHYQSAKAVWESVKKP